MPRRVERKGGRNAHNLVQMASRTPRTPLVGYLRPGQGILRHCLLPGRGLLIKGHAEHREARFSVMVALVGRQHRGVGRPAGAAPRCSEIHGHVVALQATQGHELAVQVGQRKVGGHRPDGQGGYGGE